LGQSRHSEIRVYNLFYGKGNENHQLGTGFIVHRRIVSAVKRIELVSDRLSYIVLRGHWFHIIVVNVHAPSEEKSESKESFYEELQQVFDHFPKYQAKILEKTSMQICGERIVSSQQLDRRVSIKIGMIMGLDQLTSPHHKFWWLRARCSLTRTFINKLAPHLMVRLTTRLTTY